MNQQALDLQRSMQIVRRHKILVGIVVALGILAGAAYAVLKPPMLTSTALIALPVSQSVQPATSTGAPDPFTATQEIVAGSYQVLLGAVPNIHPAMPFNELRNNVEAGSPSPNIISINVKGKNATQAESATNAVANSYISYVGSPRSAVGRVRAHLLASASSATGPSPIERMIIYALLGGLIGVLIGVIVALAIFRNDRRLRQRDEIANSIGIPVLASVPVGHPSSARDWAKLLENYTPTAVHSWQLRSALQQLGMAGPGLGRTGQNGNGSFSYDYQRAAMYDDGRSSLAVLSLSSDSDALALGPQLAVFAAAQGIPTLLVVGPQQDAAATATLRTACSGLSETPERDGLLRITAYDEGDLDIEADTVLIIVVAVVDSRAPKMPDTVRTSATVIGVSAGAASAEQLARAAVVAAADGREVTGILVADPDEDDQTTGRIPHLARPVRRRMPNRLRGIVTEIRR